MFKSFRTNQYFIHWWWGTDALKLDTFPPTSHISWYFRILIERKIHKILEPLVREHWIVGEPLRKHLLNFGIDERKIKIVECPVKYTKPFEKKKHSGFNILFYNPIKPGEKNVTFKRWKYGVDIYEQTKDKASQFSDVYWIVVDGTQDLSTILPITDIYLRPSRHDGDPRLVKECVSNDIPIYYPFGMGYNPDYINLFAFILKYYLEWRRKK